MALYRVHLKGKGTMLIYDYVSPDGLEQSMNSPELFMLWTIRELGEMNLTVRDIQQVLVNNFGESRSLGYISQACSAKKYDQILTPELKVYSTGLYELNRGTPGRKKYTLVYTITDHLGIVLSKFPYETETEKFQPLEVSMLECQKYAIYNFNEIGFAVPSPAIWLKSSAIEYTWFLPMSETDTRKLFRLSIREAWLTSEQFARLIALEEIRFGVEPVNFDSLMA